MPDLFYRDVLGRILNKEEGDANMRALNAGIIANAAGVADLSVARDAHALELTSHAASIASLQLSVTLSSTWATRPNPFTLPVGTVINFTDVGGTGGSLWRATAAGWVPLGGSVVLASNWGSMAAPVATQTGSTGALFAPTGGAGSLVIPATMLITRRSALEIEAMHRRRGANATALLSIYLGTAGTTGDSKVFDLSTPATNNQDNRPAVTVGFTTGVATISNWLAPGSANASAFIDKTTNINLAAGMTVSFGISSANAADSFDLVGYTVRLVSI